MAGVGRGHRRGPGVAASSPAFLAPVTGLVAVAGDSAGGTLAALACLRLRDVHPEALPDLQVLLYANTDLTGAHPSMSEQASGWGLDAATVRCFNRQWVPDECQPVRRWSRHWSAQTRRPRSPVIAVGIARQGRTRISGLVECFGHLLGRQLRAILSSAKAFQGSQVGRWTNLISNYLAGQSLPRPGRNSRRSARR